MLRRYGEKERSVSQGEKSPLQLLLATFVHLKNPYQMLIVPLTLWSGFEQGFMTADFTKVCENSAGYWVQQWQRMRPSSASYS